jgi:demethylspheroidene O-methyltransferase
LRNFVLRWRDRLLSSPGFRRWAAAFPLTRPIARRRARALFDLCAGFVYTQVLLACVRLDLFSILAEGAQSRLVLSVRLGLPLDGANRLLDAAIALDLAERRGDLVGLGGLGAAMIGNHGIAAMVEHHALLYRDLADPVALLRGERSSHALAGYWPYADSDRPDRLGAGDVGAYTELMAASQPFIAEEVLAAFAFTAHRCLLDVGGGDGSFLRAVARAAPELRLMLFDLPPVAARAQLRFVEAGLADRVEIHGGDAIRGALPQGADLISFVRIIHDHDDDSVLAMLRAARAALPPDGTLLIAEPMSGTAGAEPIGDAYFGFYLLAMGRGRSRSPDAIEALLARAGFGRCRRLATRLPVLCRIITAQPEPGDRQLTRTHGASVTLA